MNNVIFGWVSSLTIQKRVPLHICFLPPLVTVRACLCRVTQVEGRRQPMGVSSRLLPWGSEGSNADPRAWHPESPLRLSRSYQNTLVALSFLHFAITFDFSTKIVLCSSQSELTVHCYDLCPAADLPHRHSTSAQPPDGKSCHLSTFKWAAQASAPRL